MTQRAVALTVLVVLGTATEAFAQKNKTTCGPDLLVNVSVSGVVPTQGPMATGIYSDGAGLYVNRTRGDKVTAIFQRDNCTFDFTLNLNFSSSRSLIAVLQDATGALFTRRVNFFNFDRVGSVPITTDGVDADGNVLPFTESAWCRTMVTAREQVTLQGGQYFDNYGGCFKDADNNYYVLRYGSGMNLDGDERLGFNISPLDNSTACLDAANPGCAGTRVRVYHPDANTWRMRPDSDGTVQLVYRVWAGGEYQFRGYQHAPYEIVAVRAQ